MSLNNSIVEVKNFSLNSSTKVDDILSKIGLFRGKYVLIHIVSYMHNTILVQNLKNLLSKKIPQANIVLLKHDDKHQTYLTIYTIEKQDDLNVNDVSDFILREFFNDLNDKNISIQDYRSKLLSRYFTDHLTNFPNLYKLRSDLDEKSRYVLIVFNIDSFHTINSFYGYLVGDYVLEQVGKYLKSKLSNLAIYRLNGDEFAFIVDEEMGFYELKSYMQGLYDNIKNIVVRYKDVSIYVDFTLASCSSKDGKNIFSKVAMALKHAKEVGANFWIYEDRMNFESEYERNLKLSALVREAVEAGRIVPYFQAIADAKTLEIKKYECLARLIDKNEKIVSPMLFIPIAKRIKVYKHITMQIIEKSFETFEESEFEFSINLSTEDIMCSEIFEFIINKLKYSKASHRVIFELLESEAVEDFKMVERFISEVQRYSARVAIDDFGSGYSNFKYLANMRPDFIKIDGSLIQDIDIDKNLLMIVESIVEFSKKLGIKTIAEYVHSSVVLDIVKGLDIDYVQGFYIDEPSPVI